MICQTCHGNGFITPPAARRERDAFYPCPTCMGSGIDHCCDGDQPNPRDTAPSESWRDRPSSVSKLTIGEMADELEPGTFMVRWSPGDYEGG